MPVYSNVSLRMCCTRKYSSGEMRRRCVVGEKHMNAPLAISHGIVRKIGSFDLLANEIYDDYTIMNLENSGYTLSARKKPKEDCGYYSIDLILYTVSPKADLTHRYDAVLVRTKDAKRVNVISGGGYYCNHERCYDNVVLKARCDRTPIAIAIQRNQKHDQLRDGDYIYIVSPEGVEQIRLGKDDDESLSKYDVSFETADWQYI